MTTKVRDFSSSSSLYILSQLVFLLMFKLHLMWLSETVTALSHYFLLFFLSFWQEGMMTLWFHTYYATLHHYFCYSLFVSHLRYFTLKSGPLPSFPVYFCPYRTQGFINTWHFITPSWSFTFPFFDGMLTFSFGFWPTDKKFALMNFFLDLSNVY